MPGTARLPPSWAAALSSSDCNCRAELREGVASFHARPARWPDGAASLAHTKFSAEACGPPSLWCLQSGEEALQDGKPCCSLRRFLCSLLCGNTGQTEGQGEAEKVRDQSTPSVSSCYGASISLGSSPAAAAGQDTAQHSGRAGGGGKAEAHSWHTHSKHIWNTGEECGHTSPGTDREMSRAG